MTGLTPPEFAARHMDDSEEIVGVLNSACSTKRKRRETLVKERAVKAGVSLPPTPDSIRAPLADEPPATNKKQEAAATTTAPPNGLPAVSGPGGETGRRGLH